MNVPWELVKKAAKAGCTQDEMAAHVGISLNALKKQCLEDHGMELFDWTRQHKAGGNAELRIAQHEVAVERKNPLMLMFLGKNNLGQSDRPKNTASEAKTFVDAITKAKRLDVQDTAAFEDEELKDL